MSIPSPPSGYDVTKHVQAGRADCHITVGFDTTRGQGRGESPRFLVQLHYQAETDPVRWTEIARMDHNETSALGHDVYREGLHVDVARRSGGTVHLDVRHPPLPPNRGRVIRGCARYLRDEAAYFVDVYEGRRAPGGPPRWSDGGDPKAGSPHTLISANPLSEGMSQEHPNEDALTLKELDEVLAEATGSTPEEISKGVEIAPPSEAEVVDE